DRAALGGEIEREAHPLFFRTDFAVVASLASDRAAEQVEIKAIADDIVGGREQSARFGGAPCRIARANAERREPAAPPAAWGCLDRGRRARDRAGGVSRLAARQHQ